MAEGKARPLVRLLWDNFSASVVDEQMTVSLLFGRSWAAASSHSCDFGYIFLIPSEAIEDRDQNSLERRRLTVLRGRIHIFRQETA